MLNSVEGKVCSGCGNFRELESFPLRSDSGIRRGTCRDCVRVAAKRATKKFQQSEKGKAYLSQWNNANREHIRALERENCRERYATDTAYRELKQERARSSHHADPERSKAKMRAFHQANPEYAAAYANHRRAMKLRATPAWAKPDEIRFVYAKALEMTSRFGIEFHVDHVVPLKGKTVCGLHCWANLQLLSKPENQAKSNRVWPDMP